MMEDMPTRGIFNNALRRKVLQAYRTCCWVRIVGMCFPVASSTAMGHVGRVNRVNLCGGDHPHHGQGDYLVGHSCCTRQEELQPEQIDPKEYQSHGHRPPLCNASIENSLYTINDYTEHR